VWTLNKKVSLCFEHVSFGPINWGSCPTLFLWVIYLQNVKLKKLKNCEFESFHLPKARAKKSKNCQIHICGFHCVGKHIEGWLRIWSLFLAYRNINPKKHYSCQPLRGLNSNLDWANGLPTSKSFIASTRPENLIRGNLLTLGIKVGASLRTGARETF
jgi:hypothetical protein